jgi:hypothetical protein
MATPDTISVAQLAHLIGTPEAPAIVDVRVDADHASDPRLLPASIRRECCTIGSWAGEYAGRFVVAVCQRGEKLSQGVAAWPRHAGARAESLEGGNGLMVRPDQLPERDRKGRTVWVTRARPKVDRVACPWLIRRFIDPSAVFLFVTPPEVANVADHFRATPFDIEGVFWSHRGELCTFDTMLEEFGLHCEPLDRLAAIVRDADSPGFNIAPQAAGLLAASLGLSRMHRDDLVQLEQSLPLYDAFYRWSRDAVVEGHNWPVPSGAL